MYSSRYEPGLMHDLKPNGAERETETKGKGEKECSTMRIIRWIVGLIS